MPVLQDNITFQLRADRIVVNDTVKVTATVVALAMYEDESTLRAQIRSALTDFIGAEWKFNNIQRETDQSGYERVVLTATVRVSEKENYNLEDRARKVSKQGLQLTQVVVDSGVPAAELEKAEKELRLDLLKKVNDELEAINGVMGGSYRVSNVIYNNHGDPVSRKTAVSYNVSNAQPAGAMAFGAHSHGVSMDFGGGDDGSLANTQRVSLSASVTLSRSTYE